MERPDGEAWITAALEAVGRSVVVGIVGVQGSSPREVGARMTVSPEAIAGSIGGGMLEHMAIRRARTLIEQESTSHRLISLPLGPDTQQCCGGVVTLFFEPVTETVAGALEALAPRIESGALIATRLGSDKKRVTANDAGDRPAGNDAWLEDDGSWLYESVQARRFEVALFGAGHVGRALVTALSPLRCRVLWVDPRADEFPQQVPDNVVVRVTDDPPATIETVPPGALVLVMTHRHPLDYEVCCAALKRDDLAFVGLIGSDSKRNRFTAAMRRDGLDDTAIARLVCPIGLPGIHGKEPAVIAASVAAQLLKRAQSARPPSRRQGIGEKEADATPVADVF